MAVVVACPHCKTRLTLGDDRAGTKLECPRCDGAINVPSQQHDLLPASGQTNASNTISVNPTPLSALKLSCPKGSICAEPPGDVVGVEVVGEQYIAGSGSVSPVWGPNGPTSVRGYQETHTHYEYETRFFLRSRNGQEKFFSFPEKNLAIRDGHKVSEIYVRSIRRDEDLLVALYNYNTQMIYWLQAESDILRFLNVKRRFIVEKQIPKNYSASGSSINPLLISVGVLALVFVGIGTLLSLRSQAIAGLVLVLLAFGVGGLVLYLLTASSAPTHTREYENNPDADTVFDVLNDLFRKLQSGNATTP